MLRSGYLQPMLGYGTYKVGFIPASASDTSVSGCHTNTVDIIGEALSAGYRMLDCAKFYGNEKDVGKAIRQSDIPRSELFLCSKVWNDAIYSGPASVHQQVKNTLADLQTDYLDLCLIHWPVPGKHIEAYKALLELQKAGLIRSVGVSNYTIEDFEELVTNLEVVDSPTSSTANNTTTKETDPTLHQNAPVVVQLEVNPFLYRKKTIDFFQNKSVHVQSYRGLRQGKELNNPKVTAIAEKHNHSPAQVLGRWLIQKGITFIPKSTKKNRINENAIVFDFELDSADMETLDGLTTQSNLEEFQKLYEKCVVRDTPLQSIDRLNAGIKTNITLG